MPCTRASRRLDAFQSAGERRSLVEVAHERFPAEGDPAELQEALERLVALDYWPTHFDGTMNDLVMLKHLHQST